MNFGKKLIACVLAAAMLFALGAPAMAETEPEADYRYVSLGASNSNGYALHGYLTEEYYNHPYLSGAEEGTPGNISGYRRTPPYSYPALVKAYLEAQGHVVDHAQLAQSTMRVEELRFLIDESFTADEYTSWRFYDPYDSWTWWYSNLDAMRADYKESITNADLITYDMGLNNFGVYLTNNLLSNSYGEDLHRVLPDDLADMFYSIRGKLEAGIVGLGIGDVDTFGTIDHLTDTIAYALLGYITNFDATMGIIREWNPDATVVVLSVQNIMAGLDISISGITIPLGDIMGIAVQIANAYTSLLSPYADSYLYADVTSANGRVTCFWEQLLDYNGDPATLDQNMRDCLDAYDTSLPIYLKFRTAARIAASMGDETAIAAQSNRNVFNANQPYFVEYCEANCPELYAQTLENEYDTIMSLFKAAISETPLSLDGIIAGADMGKLEDELVDSIFALILEVADRNINGGTFTDEDIKTAEKVVLHNDDLKLVASVGIRSSIGNTFFSHPNIPGHVELYNAIVSALENETTSQDAFRQALPNVIRSFTIGTAKFGMQFPILLLQKIFELFPTTESSRTEATKLSLDDNCIDENDFITIICDILKIDNLEDLMKLADIIDQLMAMLEQQGAQSIHCCPSWRFIDVRCTDWYHESVDYVVAKDYMTGEGIIHFNPNGTLTRAQMVTVLYNMAGEPSVAGISNQFSDVSYYNWYYKPVLWAAANGITSGTGDGKFNPNAELTREEMVIFLYNFAEYQGKDMSVSAGASIDIFADKADIDAWAADAVIWAVDKGIISGILEGGKLYFKPAETASRAQLATIICNLGL